MSRKQLVSDTVVYGGTAVLRNAVGFFLLPIYTRVMHPDQYAGMDLVLAGSALMSVLLDFQLGPSANRFYREHESGEQRRLFLGSIAVFRLWTAFLVAALAAFLAYRFGIGYLPPVQHGKLLWIIAVFTVPFSLTAELLFLYLRILEHRWLFITLSVVSAATGGGLAVILLLWTAWGAAAVLMGQALGSAVICLVIAILLRHELKPRFIPPGLRDVLWFALPLLPGTMLGWIWGYSTRFYMARKLPLSDIAIYALAMKVLIFISVIGVAFRAAFEPLSMKVLYEQENSSRAWYSSSFNLYAAVLILMGSLISAAAKPLVAALAPASYARASSLVPLLTISSCILFAATSLNIGNDVAKKTWNWSLAMLAGVVVMAAVLVSLLPFLGVSAAAVAYLAGSIAQIIVVFHTSQVSFRIPYEAGSLYAAMVAAATLIVVNLFAGVYRFPPGGLESADLATGTVGAWYILTPRDRVLLVSSGRRLVGAVRSVAR